MKAVADIGKKTLALGDTKFGIYEGGEIAPQTVVRAGEKTGRNDPCPCRSGKKYKHCCGL